MVTSEPVRDRMVALTRSISVATSSTSRSIDAFDGLSKGTITATPVSTFAQIALCSDTIESAGWCGKGREAATRRVTGAAKSRQSPETGEPRVAGIGSNQRYRAGVGDWRAARRRQHPPSGAGSEHEHYRRLARGAAAPDSGP